MYALPQSSASNPMIAFGIRLNVILDGFSIKALVTAITEASIVPLIVCGLLNLYMIRKGETELAVGIASDPTNALSLPYRPCKCNEVDEEEEERVVKAGADEDCAKLTGSVACRLGKDNNF